MWKRDYLEDPSVDGRVILRYSGIGMGGIKWIDLVQDSVRWWALVNVVINLRIPYNTWNFSSS
jgi:hypothetical protein